MQAKKDASELQEQSKKFKQDIVEAEADTKRAIEDRDQALRVIGNYVHDSVPVSNDEVPRSPPEFCIRQQTLFLASLGPSRALSLTTRPFSKLSFED